MDTAIRRGPVLRLLLWGTVAAILLTPLVAMRFTTEVNWTATDFLFAGVLLGGGGLLIELVVQRVRSPRTRLLLSGVILSAVILIWIEAAVGIF